MNWACLNSELDLDLDEVEIPKEAQVPTAESSPKEATNPSHQERNTDSLKTLSIKTTELSWSATQTETDFQGAKGRSEVFSSEEAACS